MGAWDDIKSGASRVEHDSIHPLDAIHNLSNAVGLTHDAPPDPSKGPDAQAERDFATGLRAQYAGLKPGQAQQIVSSPTQYQSLDQSYANQARATQQANIGDLQGVANGSTATAADSLLRQGTDQAARNATGLAAAYSAQNPGLALRAGLAASNNAYAQAASQAGIQKAQEQAAARQQIGSLSDSMRQTDLGAAGANQNAYNANQQFTANQGLQAQQLNQAAGLQQQGLNNQMQLGLGNLASSTTVAPINASVANQQIQAATNAQNQQGVGAIIGGVGSAVASDARLKTDIKKRSLADAMGDQVRGVVEYSYKPGEGNPGKQTGILAGDLEKVAPNLVRKDSRGMRMVDTGQAAMTGLGLAAELANRVRKLEKARQL